MAYMRRAVPLTVQRSVAPARLARAGRSPPASGNRNDGAWGDWLAARNSSLALDMTIRHVDEPRTGDVVVWLHGLCETDAAWRAGAEKHWGDRQSPHGSRLRNDTKQQTTNVYLRYNSGLHISDNGVDLSAFAA